MTPQPSIPDERADPVAALNHALTEAGREALGYAPEGGLQGVAQKALPYLAEQGYVLVNADMLAAALDVLSEDGLEYNLMAPEEREDRDDAAGRLLAALEKQP